MNNKGYASSTIIYSAIILLSLVMLAVLKIQYTKYSHQKDFVSGINEELTNCLKEGNC